MIKIEITNTDVQVRSGNAPRTGRAFCVREQNGIASVFGRNGCVNRVNVALSLGADAQPYEVGVYELAPESLYVNRFGQFEVSPVLKAVSSH